MKIVFTKDYIGRETAMQEKKKGDEVEIGTAFALTLIELGVAEEVEDIFETLPEFDSSVARISKPKRKAVKEFDE